MKGISLFLCLLALSLITSSPGAAQLPVSDAGNQAINALTLAETILVVDAMVKNLLKKPGGAEAVIPLMTELEELIRREEGFSYGDPGVSQRFERLFPGYTPAQGLFAEKNELWVSTQLDTMRGILEAAKRQHENFEDGQRIVAGRLEDSNAAKGNLQALQAGNAIKAGVVKQVAKLRQLMLADINLETVTTAAEVNRRAQQEAKVASWAWQGSRRIVEAPTNDSRGIGKLSEVKNWR